MGSIAPARPRRMRSSARRAGVSPTLLGTYADKEGRPREVIARAGAAGSTLVIDRLAFSAADPCLVAHLAADEPRQNARIVCALYLADRRGRRCRRLREEDLVADPLAALAGPSTNGSDNGASNAAGPLLDRAGNAYRLMAAREGPSTPELRWRRTVGGTENGLGETVSLRDVVGKLESYEPARAITAAALATRRGDPRISTGVLRGELVRLNRSRIVLNRALRAAIQAAIADGDLSMSEIAMRCGRIKRDHRGNVAGETSWLARRIGLMAEGGGERTTPWIHSATLALIARRGLGIAPREVELG
jgi:hypothetical protein